MSKAYSEASEASSAEPESFRSLEVIAKSPVHEVRADLGAENVAVDRAWLCYNPADANNALARF